MNEDVFNLTLRQFLKTFGIAAQREIEQAVRAAVERGPLRGSESLPVQARLTMKDVPLDFTVEGTIRLGEKGNP